MSKAIFLAAAAVTGVSTIATVYYVSPIGVVANDTPPILVDLSPAEVVRKIRTISIESYIQHFGADNERTQAEIGQLVELVRRDESDTETLFQITRGDDLLMQFRVVVKPVQGSKSEVEVNAVAGESRFRADPSLHPYDIQLLQSVADFLATDYVSSLLKGHPVLSGERLEYELEKRYAKDEGSIKAAARRIEKTFLATYGQELKDEAESYAQSAHDSYDADYAEAEAEAEAGQAAEAAAYAADRTAAAVDAASAAADAAMAAAAAEDY